MVQHKNFVMHGNWMEERHEALKNLFEEELWEDIKRLHAAHLDRLTVKSLV